MRSKTTDNGIETTDKEHNHKAQNGRYEEEFAYLPTSQARNKEHSDRDDKEVHSRRCVCRQNNSTRKGYRKDHGYNFVQDDIPLTPLLKPLFYIPGRRQKVQSFDAVLLDRELHREHHYGANLEKFRWLERHKAEVYPSCSIVSLVTRKVGSKSEQ